MVILPFRAPRKCLAYNYVECIADSLFTRILNNWSCIDRLHNVKAVTLVINGRLDIGQDFVCSPFFYKINKCKWVRFEESSHMSFWEERERYMEVLGGFLTENLE